MPAKSQQPQVPDIPAKALRDFLRQAAQLPQWDEKFLRSVLHLDAGGASAVLTWMMMLGHIETVSGRKSASTWRTTPAGSALAGVKSGKPLKRDTIRKDLDALPERIRLVNTNPIHSWTVVEAVLFGPFHTTDADVQTADVAVSLRPKRSDSPARTDTADARKARRAVLRALKGRGRGLALFEIEDWIRSQPHRNLFQTSAP